MPRPGEPESNSADAPTEASLLSKTHPDGGGRHGRSRRSRKAFHPAHLVGDDPDGPRHQVIAAMCRALGDPARLRMLTTMATRGQVCVCDLVSASDLSGPTVSYHLKVLREAGLVNCQRRGTWVYYWLVPAAVDQLAQCLAAVSARSTR